MSLKLPRVLIPESKIQQRVRELGAEITRDYKGKDLVAICVLKGSYMFFSDLIRAIELPIVCEFIGCSSYGNKFESSGEVKITMDTTEPLKGRHLLIVEDIIDSGNTIDYLISHFKSRKPASIKICSLLLKEEAIKKQISADYIGFKIGNEFVVGYGLDYQSRYRQIPYVGVMDNEV
jgi:hypoxanthine phosphoribosyltransferase